MPKKQIIPFLILVAVTLLAAYIIVFSGNYSTTVDSLQDGLISSKKQVVVTEPVPVVPVDEAESKAASTS